MCRFVAYLGKPITADELLIKPKNSLLHQSMHALETSMPVNGDGFGVGWYHQSIRKEPALFRSTRPAWNDENLLTNAGLIRSNCIMAHVRAATEGGVSRENTHPFRYKEFLMMQNGGIRDFAKIKRRLINRLDETSFLWVNGQTDTQYIFALFMTIAKEYRKNGPLTLDDLTNCFSETFSEIESMKKAVGSDSVALYNLVLTNGHEMVATRYSTKPEKESRSLHIASKAECYVCEQGYLRFRNAHPKAHSALIASEVLTDEIDFWQEVPENHSITVDKDLNIEIKPLP